VTSSASGAISRRSQGPADSDFSTMQHWSTAGPVPPVGAAVRLFGGGGREIPTETTGYGHF
jgi:hypothetical protein